MTLKTTHPVEVAQIKAELATFEQQTGAKLVVSSVLADALAYIGVEYGYHVALPIPTKEKNDE